jgi:GNAT superfamily N-acetyltransferase
MSEESTISLRRFQPGDTDAVWELVNHTIDACYQGVYPPEAVAAFIRFNTVEQIIADAGQGSTLVIDHEGTIIGTGTLVGNYIKRVFVEPGFQGMGLGRLIMEILEEEAKAQGQKSATLSASLPSKIFYEDIGYIILGERSIPVENNEILAYFEMEKYL